MTITIETLLTVLSTLFGGTGIIAYVGARKERIAQANISEAGAVAAMQGVYRNLVVDTDGKFEAMRKEISDTRIEMKMVKEENFQLKQKVETLESQVEEYQTNCAKCTNNKTK